MLFAVCATAGAAPVPAAVLPHSVKGSIMKATLFDKVMAMSDAEREQEPYAPLDVVKIEKIAAHVGVDFTTAASVVMKNDAASYAKYRAESFRRVQS